MKCVNIKLWDILGRFHYILNPPRILYFYFVLANSANPDEMPPYFIWVFTVCHITNLGVSSPQRVNSTLQLQMHELWNLSNCVHVSNFKQSQEVSAKLNYHMDLYLKKYSQLILQCIEMSRNMRFPTMWYVRPAKAQTCLRIRAD